jgi:hypothetical protein
MPNDIKRGCWDQKGLRQRHQRSNPEKDPRNRFDPIEPKKNPGSTSETRLKAPLERDLSFSLGLHLKAPFMRPTTRDAPAKIRSTHPPHFQNLKNTLPNPKNTNRILPLSALQPYPLVCDAKRAKTRPREVNLWHLDLTASEESLTSGSPRRTDGLMSETTLTKSST